MELVMIVATITSFFSHLMIEKSIVANAVSVALATLVTWLLIGDMTTGLDVAFVRNILYTAVIAFAISIIVGLVFVTPH